ncbi:bifunctional diguanylate cyclase/phosphodiesterase [Oleiagrimonas sp. C23AA]|uniref:putative bifunctional diguanylate cyclase/phosphodiesterase n=1 Tax=Oleiagrimonas sp. C23AA TaxID=2719047 RepID=UPI00141F4086|nr:bifunctional diguanylate cyclase/phosphodiesterase [Oleiagrimonas sp. C23AA]NII09228.1 bifunctional diguanylate cyclase/phosphodiesterase [Oleiagrimonas sp. C23AA]
MHMVVWTGAYLLLAYVFGVLASLHVWTLPLSRTIHPGAHRSQVRRVLGTLAIANAIWGAHFCLALKFWPAHGISQDFTLLAQAWLGAFCMALTLVWVSVQATWDAKRTLIAVPVLTLAALWTHLGTVRAADDGRWPDLHQTESLLPMLACSLLVALFGIWSARTERGPRRSRHLFSTMRVLVLMVLGPVLLAIGELFVILPLSVSAPVVQGDVWSPFELGVVMVEVVVATSATALVATWFSYGVEQRLQGFHERLAGSSAALRRAERHDALTGLPTRVSYYSAVSSLIESAQQRKQGLAVYALDVDSFGLLNEAHGSAGGDEVLRVLGQRLRMIVPGGAAMARIGADAFGVAVPGIRDAQAARAWADALVDFISYPVTFGGHELPVSFAVGACLYPQGGDQPAYMAERALGAARRRQADRYVLYEMPRAPADMPRQLLTLREQLEAAMRDGTLELYLQPICGAISREVMGAEALMRFHQPDGRMLSPDHVLDVAARFGLLGRLGWYVIELACQHLHTLNDQGIDLPLSVNVDPRLFVEDGFVERLLDTMRRFRIGEGCLVIELTENALLDDTPRVRELFSQLREAGMLLAIDDFGSGYSNLRTLTVLQVDVIKVDRFFVSRLPEDVRCRAMLSAVVGFSRLTGTKVVAEGVETEEQATWVASLGLHRLQGFLAHAPMPVADFMRLLSLDHGSQRGLSTPRWEPSSGSGHAA